MSDTAYIYTLIDPRDNRPFYVGQTTRPEFRLSVHIKEAQKQLKKGWWGSFKERRMVEILLSGHKPTMRLIGVSDKANVYADEHSWIKLYEAYGYELVNQQTRYYKQNRPTRYKKYFFTR